jgi:hypothetical protein
MILPSGCPPDVNKGPVKHETWMSIEIETWIDVEISCIEITQ